MAQFFPASGGTTVRDNQPNGQTAIIVPTVVGWGPGTSAFSATRVYAARFVLSSARTITAIRFRSVAAGTGNVDVALLDATGTRLGSSGSTAGAKGANTNQQIALSASVALTAGTVYYATLETDTADGTFMTAAYASSGLEQFFGTTIGLAEGFIKDTTFPTPASVALGFVSNTPPLLGLVF